VKNYMASTILTPEAGAGHQLKTRQRPDDDSFNRLFGAADAVDGPVTPRGKNYPKGNIAGIFNGENGEQKSNGHANGHANGHTNGHTNGHNGHANGVNGTNGTNGHSNGHNGYENGNGNGSISSGASSGSATPNGSINGDVKMSKLNWSLISINASIRLILFSSGVANIKCCNLVNPDGHYESNAIPLTPSRRIPPGGYSSKLW
jgi:hypothetical protein